MQVFFPFSSLLLSLCGRQQVLAQSNEGSTTTLNEQCELAIALSLGDSVSASTVKVVFDQAINEINLLQCRDNTVFNIGTPGLWYTYQADTSRVVRLSTCAEETNFANRITVFSLQDGDCSSRFCVATSIEMDPNCSNGNSTILELTTKTSVLYAINIHQQDSGFSGDFGFSIDDISAPPENASCNSTMELPHNETVQGTTVGASMTEGLQSDGCIERGPNNPGVVYYIPPVTIPSKISLSLAGSEVPFEIRLYEGPTCGELECTKKEIDTEGSKGLVTFASWLAEVNEDFYIHVSAASSDDNVVVTDRFGIRMVQTEVSAPQELPSSAVTVSAMSILRVLLLAWFAC